MRRGEGADAQVPFTARGIALAVHCLRRSRAVRRLDAARDWLAHGVDAEASLARGATTGDGRLLPWLRCDPVRRLFLAAVDGAVPGTARHLLRRKLWFHAQATAFLREFPGRTSGQVVVLGAGLDGLGWRLAEAHPRARIIVVDRPGVVAVQAAVCTAACSAACTAATPPRFVALDLAADRAVTAADLGADPARPTLAVAEGLLMYLAPATVRRLCADLVRSFRGELRFVFSALDATALADPRSPVGRLGRRLRRRGEPFAWATTAAALPAFLAASGLRLRATSAGFALPPGVFGSTPDRPGYGEWMARADG